MSQNLADLSAVVLDRLSSEAALPVPLAITRFAHALSPGSPLNIHPSSDPPALFLSVHTVDTCYNTWLALPIPSRSELSELRRTLSTQPDAQSLELLYLGRTIRLPLFVVNLWPRLQSLVSLSRDWEAVAATLNRLSTAVGIGSLASILLAQLPSLALDAPIPGLLHLRSSNLPTIISDDWLSDDHINAAAQIIQLHPRGRKSVAVLDSWFMVQLKQHFERHGEFSTRRSKSVDMGIVDGLVTELLIPVYSPSHWSLIHVNIMAQTYSYTDTLNLEAHTPPPNCLAALTSWLNHIIGSEFPLLPSPRPFRVGQQMDSHSCGVAVISSFAHYVVGGSFQAWFPTNATMHRLQWAHLFSKGLDDLTESTFDFFDFDDASSPPTTCIPSTVSTGSVDNNLGSLFNSTTSVASPKPKGSLIQLQLPFQRVTRDEWLASEKQRYLDRRAEIEDRLAQAELSAIKKDIKRREYNRRRKNSQRARQRELRAALKSLNEPDESSTQSDSHLADPDPNVKERLSAFMHSRPPTAASTLPRWKKSRIRPTKRMNWCHPLVWPVIDQAAQYVGFPWSPKAIVRRCQAINPTLFATLRPQRVSQWRDHTVPDALKWKDSHLKAVEAGAQTIQEDHGRKGIFHDQPHVVQSIRTCLTDLRTAGVSLSLNTIRGYMVGVIQHHIPDAFTREYRNGQPFKCSKEFVRKFLHDQLSWSIRKATRAAQKYPSNIGTVLLEAFLRLACIIRDEDIPSCCIVNADQTQVVYNPGDQKTWTTSGSRQIAIVGSEDKRAFTLMVAVSNSGILLPFQAIYAGLSPRSLPNLATPSSQEAIRLGFSLDYSRSSNYWSSFATMCLWVSQVLVPYFQAQKILHQLPENQRCILQLDCWAVHRSERFRSWMTENYPWILLQYVPGGCTGLFQACDVGIQRVLKLAIAKASHADVVVETVTALQSGIPANQVVNDQSLPTLRSRSVGWITKGYHAVNKPELIKKAFSLCTVPGTEFNLSYESLTSRPARQAILDLRSTNPSLYAEITQTQGNRLPEGLNNDLLGGTLDAQTEEVVEAEGDDEGLSVEEVRAIVLGAQTAAEAAEPVGLDEDEEFA